MGRDLTRNYRPTVRSDYNDAPEKRRRKPNEPYVTKSWQGRQNAIGKKSKKSKMPKIPCQELKSVISLAVSMHNFLTDPIYIRILKLIFRSR